MGLATRTMISEVAYDDWKVACELHTLERKGTCGGAWEHVRKFLAMVFWVLASL